MRKFFYVILVMQLIFTSCSKNEETTEILEALLEIPSDWGFKLMPWCITCSDANLPGVTMFNNSLQENKDAVKFFNRSDCFSVLKTKYQIAIEEKNENSTYFEMILASDLCMSALNEKEKMQLMTMALTRAKDEKTQLNETCHIMVAVMQSLNYIPFMEEINPKLRETTTGYTLSSADDSLLHFGLCCFHAEIIIQYTKQFLNEKK